MRKHILLLGATLVGGVLFAQPSVIGVHPAHDGKLLTMENAIVGRISPENRYYSWVNDNEYRFMDGRSMATARRRRRGGRPSAWATACTSPTRRIPSP